MRYQTAIRIQFILINVLCRSGLKHLGVTLAVREHQFATRVRANVCSDQLRQRSFKERINKLAGEFREHLEEMTKALDAFLEVRQHSANLYLCD